MLIFNNPETLKDLSDWQIARLIISSLWNQYDVSGISYGRSLRAALLETIVFNTDKPSYEFFLNDLENEAKKRGGIGEPNQLVLNLGLAGLPSHHFFCFVIREINRWYIDYAHDTYGPILIYERRMIGILFSLMLVNEHLRQFDEKGIRYSADELLDEGKEINYTANNCSGNSLAMFS